MNRKLPAYPIFVKDPNFSLWAVNDTLNAENLHSWYGEEKPIYGFLKADGETYCFLGKTDSFSSCGVKKAEQTDVTVSAFSTDYTFKAGNATLKVRFVSPLPPNDLELMSMPVCYMEYEVTGVENAEISLFLNRRNAYNARNEQKEVRGGIMPFHGFEAAFIGLKRQLPLSNNDDLIGADWGYFYTAGESAYFLDEKDLAAYLVGGLKNFTYQSAERYVGAINAAKKGVIAVAYDEGVSIDYFGTYKKGWYLEDHTIVDALYTTFTSYEKINAQLTEFDEALKEKAAKFGEKYYNILVASLRQSVAGHKLIKGKNGEALFLSKENGSNGCIATVDVSYPSMPLYLIYNPELVKGMMRPILEFARMPVWTYDFAPHDAGTYPACCGQVYGLAWNKNRYQGNYCKDGYPQTHFPIYLLPAEFDAFCYEMQMPVEECANLLVMFYACFKQDNDIAFFKDNKDLCDKWVEYLVKYGLKPENQLCTDDFAGHLANNINLAIKAVVGIGSYASLMQAMGEDAKYQEYRKIAEEYAAKIVAFGKKFKHIPITWDSDDTTFSLKYNFAFDKLLGMNLFPQDVFEREIDCYIEKMNEYGTPLDSRKGYTKSDWQMWTATLTDDNEKRKLFVEKLNAFLETSPARIPFGDWFETEGGKFWHFRARTVQGGCFILLML